MRALALAAEPGDLVVVRAALALGPTTVVAAAPDDAGTRQLLGAAAAAGATRLVRLWDDALAATDFLGVAHTLAALVRTVAGDLSAPPTALVCGDRGRGAVGPALAERLGLPHLGQVVALGARAGELVAERRARGRIGRYAATAPAVLSVLPSAAGPAADAPKGSATTTGGGDGAGPAVEVIPLDDIGISAGELAARARLVARGEAAPPAWEPRRFRDVAELAARLRADGLLPRRAPTAVSSVQAGSAASSGAEDD